MGQAEDMETVMKRTKALLLEQLSPAKTLRQLVEDRDWFRALIHVAVVFVLFE